MTPDSIDTLGDVRALLANPDLSADQRERAIAIEVEVVERQRLASVEAQAAARHAEAAEARARAAEKVRVHPATHPGPCPPPGGAWISRGEVERLASRGVWHLDVDQTRPDWWPGDVVAPPSRIGA